MRTVTITRNHFRDGARVIGQASLTPVTDAPTRTYLVSIDENLAHYFLGRAAKAGVAGGLARPLRGRTWAAVAYLDRDAFLRGGGSGAFLDDVASLRAGVETLCRYWSQRSRRELARADGDLDDHHAA